MKVLYLTNNPNLGSTARILQSWIRWGREAGIEPVVVGQKQGDFTEWLREQEVPHLVDPMPWPDKRRPIPSLWHALRVARWAGRRGVQIIHCNEHDVYPFATFLRRMLPRPLVCHVRFAIARDFTKWAMGAARRCPDALLWTSHQQRQDCREAVEGVVPEQRQHVVRLGIDLDTFGGMSDQRQELRRKWNIADDAIVVGTAGALRPRKRIEDFIEIVEPLAKSNPQVAGLIAGDAMPGDEAYRDELNRAIEATGLGHRLQCVGHLEPVEPFYHACDIFVSTSEYETFGNSVCEAMACGLPVVAYSGGSVAEVVGDSGIVVPTKDTPGLQQALASLVQDPERRAELGRQSRRRVETCFNPAASFAQLLEIYQTLLPDTPLTQQTAHVLSGN